MTVTDSEVTRYFMTIQEAVQLVIQAAAIGRDGEALVLDMGRPVRIAQVAKQMSEAANAPVEIVYTGLLVLMFLFITWFSVYVVYKLYQGQR